jgi:hypothetical protein
MLGDWRRFDSPISLFIQPWSFKIPIQNTACYKIPSEVVQKCKQAIRKFVDYIQHHEPGTHLYTETGEGMPHPG